MGAGSSIALKDAPDPVPRAFAEKKLGAALGEREASEWALYADGEDRVSKATLLAVSNKYARAETFFATLGEFFRHRRDIDALWATLEDRAALEAVEPVDRVKVEHRYEAVGQQVAPRSGAAVDRLSELYESADYARPAFEVALRRWAGASEWKVAPLKAKKRAMEKATFDYADRPNPLS